MDAALLHLHDGEHCGDEDQLCAGRGTINAIFIVHQLQEKFTLLTTHSTVLSSTLKEALGMC